MTEMHLRQAHRDVAYTFMNTRNDSRKKQLAFCACCRVTWYLVELECNRAALEASEAFADGQLPLRTLKRRWNAIRFEPVVHYHWYLGAAGPANAKFPNLSVRTGPQFRAVEAFKASKQYDIENWSRAMIERVIDVFGHELNEFRFDRAWATDTAVAVARQMYESREFGAMPILADALQDAGCDCDTILNHCRDTTRAHVRGCWVVDLVLGK